MKKIKHEQELVKMALSVGETYAIKRGFDGFTDTMAVKQKVEVIYRLLVNDKLVTPLRSDQEDLLSMKQRLAIWIRNKLPENHVLLQ